MERIAAAPDVRADTANGFRCSRCKSPLIDGAKFCSTCGREFQHLVSADDSPPIDYLGQGGRYLEKGHRQAVVNTLVQTTGTIVLATCLVFVVYLCTR